MFHVELKSDRNKLFWAISQLRWEPPRSIKSTSAPINITKHSTRAVL